MQPNLHTAYKTTAYSGESHKVLRNTYGLLALSMVPTVIGGAIGANMSFAFMAASPIMSVLAMMVVIYGLMFAYRPTAQRTGCAADAGLHFCHGSDAGAFAASGTEAVQRCTADHGCWRRHRSRVRRNGGHCHHYQT